ncbi:GNAT family N-acetyltransferase [Agromyces albus]|uniref:GNAT family N-acetyltransferase n=1 Tax=Agromyces albus TaxID=205332 RepID=UPI00277ED40C|nr:GNAT family N-acetyltransferase [Agromyces albus]MDQ0576627.1 GNAT superfamily N-acetyltransferase [Agromyces albus]
MLIRLADATDSAAIASLLGELGYPTTPSAVAARFVRVASSAQDAAWLALDDDGEPIGFAAGHHTWVYVLDAPVAELTSLVVTEASRGTGAGRALVDAFEAWCAAAGCVRASVASSFRRVDAHAFYERLGYEQLAKKFEKAFANVIDV